MSYIADILNVFASNFFVSVNFKLNIKSNSIIVIAFNAMHHNKLESKINHTSSIVS